MEDDSWESALKFIVIGDTEVGKSSLMLQLVERRFQPEHEMTFGVECASYVLHVGEHPIELEIWDTAGQEAYMSITRSYYRNADGCVLVYDITRRETFQNLPRWLREAEENTNNPQLVTILVGNKADLSDQRQVTTQEAAEFAAANGLMFMEVSVRTTFSDVEEVFRRATRRIVELQHQDDEDFDEPFTPDGHYSPAEPSSPLPQQTAAAPPARASSGPPSRRTSPVPSPSSPVRPVRAAAGPASIKLTNGTTREQKTESECACS